ncbi:MAG TPA: phage holin family protein [Kribbella sp.]|nr:phage holin family protein [Kribbella sp.]
MRLVVKLLVNAVALGVAIWLLAGITLRGSSTTARIVTLLVVAAIFAVINSFVRPLAKLLSLPFIVLTLGLLIFVINALMLLLTSWISGGLSLAFHVDGFWTALVGSLIVSIVSWLLNVFLPDDLET